MNKNHLTRLISLLATAFLLYALSACDNSNNNSETTSVVKLPINIQKLALVSGDLTAWITVDGTQTQMTIDSVAGTASATITGLTLDTHTVLIEFKFTDSNQTILIATSTRSVDLSAGSATTSFVEADYITTFDEDQDGLSNLAELAWGKNPFGQPAFSVSCFPFIINNLAGNLAFNYDGDLLIADNSNFIRLMNHTTCNVTTLATISGEELRGGVIEDKARNRVYAGGTNSIFEINPVDGTWSVLVNVGAFVNSIVLAPPEYGSYGGQLIAGTFNGDILAVDQSVVSPTPVVIATVSGARVSSMVFGNDGTLYATDYAASKIVTVAANGTLTDFVDIGIDSPDGLTIDNSGSLLFIADDVNNQLHTASIPSGTRSLLGTINFDTGWAPSGLAYDNHETLLMITAASQIEARLPSSFDTFCLPLGVTGTSAGYASYTSYGAGDLLFTSSPTNDIRLLKRSDCSFSTLASNVSGGELLGITFDPSLNMIYAGSSDSNIYRVDPANGSSTVLTSVAGIPVDVVIAPSGYDNFGGQLIVALSNGDVIAIDQTQASPTPSPIMNTGLSASALVFGSDGTLYVADFSADNILTRTSTGVTAVFADNLDGISGPDGLAIDNNNGRLFVANSGDDTLRQVTIPGGVVSDLSGVGTVNFDNGVGASGIFFDQYDTLLLGEGEVSQTIKVFSL